MAETSSFARGYVAHLLGFLGAFAAVLVFLFEQVIKLGVLRTLGGRIPVLLAALCHNGLARYGTVANTLIEANERVLFLGRLCKARKTPPG